MKKNISTAALAALLLLSTPLAAVLTGCKGASAEPEWTEPVEIVTLPEVTVPEAPDERVYTDLTTYTDRVRNLFASSVLSPSEDFTYTADEGGVTVTGYQGGDPVVVIPDTIDGASVTAIGSDAFADKTFIEAISVPDTVTSIGRGAFRGCKSLKSLRTPTVICEDAPYFGALFGAETFEANGYTVPTELTTLVISEGTEATTEIPDTAFYACRSLEVVALPESVRRIGDFAFYGCQSLVYVHAVETQLQSVGRNAFANCTDLRTLELPATVETLGFAMLEGCGKLESLTLPFVGGHRFDAGVAEAEDSYLGYLFGAADYTFTKGFLPSSLISVTLLEGCGDLAPNAFFECAPLREIHLPEGVAAIGRRAFYGCEGLAEMTLPDSVGSVGDDAFVGCLRMTAFTAGKSLTSLGTQTFMNCLSLKQVTLPVGVTYLPNSCFAGCTSLETLEADGVTAMGKQVFRHCGRLGAPWVSTAPATSDSTSP